MDYPSNSNIEPGARFGRWTVISEAGESRTGKRKWACRCACGAERPVFDGDLRSGHSKSCGCLRVEVGRCIGQLSTHGDTRGNVAGRQQRTPEYAAWSSMISRCTDPNVPNYRIYGGRGIQVCSRWRNSYEAFLIDVGRRPSPRHSLDRFPDQNGNYEPGNVRWATTKQQGRNRRSNTLLTIHGVTRCLAEWAELKGINLNTLRGRLRNKWPAAQLFNKLQKGYPAPTVGAGDTGWTITRVLP